MLRHAPTTIFKDPLTNRTIRACINYDVGWVAVGLFSSAREEVEVAMRHEEAHELLAALQTASPVATPLRGWEKVSARVLPPLVLQELVSTIFPDLETAEETWAVIRHNRALVALYLCNDDDGDIEVTMRQEAARGLVEALTVAVEGSAGEASD